MPVQILSCQGLINTAILLRMRNMIHLLTHGARPVQIVAIPLHLRKCSVNSPLYYCVLCGQYNFTQRGSNKFVSVCGRLHVGEGNKGMSAFHVCRLVL